MNKLIYLLLISVVLVSCSKEERYTTKISGTWKLDKLEKSTYDQGVLLSSEVQESDFKLSFYDNEGGVNRLFFSGDSLTGTFFDREIEQTTSKGYYGVISYKMNDESKDRLDFNKIICTVTKLSRNRLEFHIIGTDATTGNLAFKQAFFMKRQ